VRKERPDYMVMWGWGAMNATAVKEAAKIKYPLDKFIGNWWAGAHADLRPVGEEGARATRLRTSPVLVPTSRHFRT
jgi:branched-chain amino acid transport system substrate-binding protein